MWRYSTDISSRTVDVHVASLRQKLETNPASPERLITVRGLGYRLELASRGERPIPFDSPGMDPNAFFLAPIGGKSIIICSDGDRQEEKMKGISVKRVFALVVSMCVSISALSYAEGSSAGWTPGFGLRLFGLDLDFTKDVPELLPIGKTEFLFAFGGGYVGRGFYRNADGTRSGANTGKISSIDADLWLKATQFLDKASHLRASLFIRGQSLQNNRDSGGEPSLLALSGLPEAGGAAELGAGAAFGYTDYDKKTSSGQEIGVKADLSYEFSYEFYPAAMSTGLVNEFAAEFSGFLSIVNTETVSLVLGEHLLASALMGTDLPEYRRSGLGGNRYLPYKALGGIVRGVPDNSGDGLLKAGENLELRIAFPSLLKGIVIPGVTVFADAGLADDGSYGSDLGTFRASAGAIVTINTLGFTLGGGAVYEFTQGYFGPYVALGTQF